MPHELPLTSPNIGFTAIGVFIGIIIGVMPDLGKLPGMLLLIPFAIYMAPISGLSFLIGIFEGGIFGGTVTVTFLRIPGTPIAAATFLDR